MSHEPDVWSPFDGGRTIGTLGSEGGTILADDEIVCAARISLERDCRSAPFAITCGIYFLMFHTHFCGDEAAARRDYAAMKQALDIIVRTYPLESEPDYTARMEEAERLVNELLERFS
jgi:hypothetical protein